MRHAEISELIPAPRERVFDLVHDYSRRLEWDTLLSAAYLDDGFKTAQQGATSVCVGKAWLGRIALKTVYVAFDRPNVAAVKMINAPPFFATWGASIRHADDAPGFSRITYSYTFRAKPAFLRWLFEPILGVLFRRETRKRLGALRRHFERRAA